jgi:hypothetical protein
MDNRLGIRISKKEKAELVKLAKLYDLTVTDYVKLKLFTHNSDYLEEDVKFIAPKEDKQAYFLAMSQVKLMLTLEKLFEKQGLMSKEEFRIFEKEASTICRQTISAFGYQKIESLDE